MVSIVPLMEQQLDLTMRLLLGFSVTMTPDELKSVCERLGHMHHTMGHLLVARTLESEGVALIGNYHWGRGDLETSGNILGKLWALDHFSPNVSTNHILGTFRL